MKLDFQSYDLSFKTPSGTSRGILKEKKTYLFRLKTFDAYETEFFGECGLFKGLSADDREDYESKLNWVCENFDLGISELWENLREFPSIQFGIEQVTQSQKQFANTPNYDGFNPILFPSEFTNGQKGIPINGLIWMGNKEFMKEQIRAKLNEGFRCLKLKIGIDWSMEYEILNQLRKEFNADTLELRVDANGGFSYKESKTVLEQLAGLQVHSIEQPIKAGNLEQMSELCEFTPTPIALDEELIGAFHQEQKKKIIETIKPQYIILKPSLIGGWRGSQEWIDLANEHQIGWWITSALESNIGLNAIAQWTYTLKNAIPQGLGTGGLFKNNFHSRLKIIKDQLYFQ